MEHAVRDRSGYKVYSAGVGAADGLPPSENAIRAMAELNIDITHQRSRQLNARLVEQADLILGMTHSHVDAIHLLFPQAAEKTFLLREFDETLDSCETDISDPIGGSLEVYVNCRKQIEQGIASMLKFIDQSTKAASGDAPATTSIAVGSDHGGFELKEFLKRYLQKQGYSVTDFGARP